MVPVKVRYRGDGGRFVSAPGKRAKTVGKVRRIDVEYRDGRKGHHFFRHGETIDALEMAKRGFLDNSPLPDSETKIVGEFIINPAENHVLGQDDFDEILAKGDRVRISIDGGKSFSDWFMYPPGISPAYSLLTLLREIFKTGGMKTSSKKKGEAPQGGTDIEVIVQVGVVVE